MESRSNGGRSRKSGRRLRLIIFLVAAVGLTGSVIAAYAGNKANLAGLEKEEVAV